MPCNTPPPPISIGDDDSDLSQNDEEGAGDMEIIDIDELTGQENDDSIQTFVSHTDAVFCCNYDATGFLVVSGGKDDKAYVWHAPTGYVKFTCDGHTDSVIAASFNHDSTLVATAGMDGLVQVFDSQSGAKVWNFDTEEISWMYWHPTSNILFAGTVDGNCWKWSVPDGLTCDIFPGNGSLASSGLLFSQGTRCAVGYADGTVKIWNTENTSVVASLTGSVAHSSDVVSMACSPDENLIVTGSVDGTAKLLKPTNCKVLHTWHGSDGTGDETESIESVGFFKSHPLVATGSNAGNLRIFDLSTNVQRAAINLNDPIVKLICDSTSPYVYVAIRGGVELYDGRSVELIRKWEGHSLHVMDLAISHLGTLLTASDDKTCKIFMV